CLWQFEYDLQSAVERQTRTEQRRQLLRELQHLVRTHRAALEQRADGSAAAAIGGFAHFERDLAGGLQLGDHLVVGGDFHLPFEHLARGAHRFVSIQAHQLSDVTRSTSSIVVVPSSDFTRPSSYMVRMPSARACSSILPMSECCMTRRRIGSLMT